jgi:hypothetical protein
VGLTLLVLALPSLRSSSSLLLCFRINRSLSKEAAFDVIIILSEQNYRCGGETGHERLYPCFARRVLIVGNIHWQKEKQQLKVRVGGTVHETSYSNTRSLGGGVDGYSVPHTLLAWDVPGMVCSVACRVQAYGVAEQHGLRLRCIDI